MYSLCTFVDRIRIFYCISYCSLSLEKNPYLTIYSVCTFVGWARIFCCISYCILWSRKNLYNLHFLLQITKEKSLYLTIYVVCTFLNFLLHFVLHFTIEKEPLIGQSILCRFFLAMAINIMKYFSNAGIEKLLVIKWQQEEETMLQLRRREYLLHKHETQSSEEPLITLQKQMIQLHHRNRFPTISGPHPEILLPMFLSNRAKNQLPQRLQTSLHNPEQDPWTRH